MKITFTLADDSTKTFTKLYLDEVPKIKETFEIFGLAITLPSLSLVVLYDPSEANETGTDREQWNYWFQENYPDIVRILIEKDAGTDIWEGVIDIEAEIEIDLENFTMKLEFIGEITDQLDETISGDVESSSFFLDGEGAFADIVELFFSTYLSDYTVHNPDISEPYIPVIQASDFPVAAYDWRYKMDWDGLTVLDALKDLCLLGYMRMVFVGYDVYCFSYAQTALTTEPDGNLAVVSHKLIRKSLIDYTMKSTSHYIVYREWEEDPPPPHLVEHGWVISQARVNSFYEDFSELTFREYKLTGINSNLHAGQYIELDETEMAIIELQRDLAYIEEDLQPVDLKVLEIISS